MSWTKLQAKVGAQKGSSKDSQQKEPRGADAQPILEGHYDDWSDPHTEAWYCL